MIDGLLSFLGLTSEIIVRYYNSHKSSSIIQSFSAMVGVTEMSFFSHKTIVDGLGI